MLGQNDENAFRQADRGSDSGDTEHPGSGGVRHGDTDIPPVSTERPVLPEVLGSLSWVWRRLAR